MEIKGKFSIFLDKNQNWKNKVIFPYLPKKIKKILIVMSSRLGNGGKLQKN